MKDVPETCRAH